MPTIAYKKKQVNSSARDESAPLLGRATTVPPSSPPAPSASTGKKPFLEDTRVGRQSVIFFTRQLLTLHKAGIPISEALGTIAAHEKHAYFKKTILRMRRDVEEGTNLTNAMRKHPKIFSSFFTGVVESGEQNGVLEPLLLQLVQFQENEENLSKNIKAALRYPVFVMITLALAFTVIMAFIFPRFKPLFSKFGDNLPIHTKILLGISTTIQNHWYLILGGLFALVGLYIFAKRFTFFVHFIDRLKFRIPLLGKLYRYANISQIANMLSTFFSGGIVNYLNILHLLDKSFSNVVIKDEIRRLNYGVTNGRTLGESMEQSRLFPPLFAHLTHVGEKTGEIQSLMKILYEYYEQELRYRTQKLIANIEPMILLVTSGFVLLIALGIFMPYWKLMDIVK